MIPNWLLKWHRKRLTLKLAKQPTPATREQLIAHYEHTAIRSINCDTKSEEVILSVATGVLRLIDPISPPKEND